MFGREVSDRCSKTCIWRDVEIQKLAHSLLLVYCMVTLQNAMWKSGEHGYDDMKTKAVSELSVLFNVLVKGCVVSTYE